MTQLLMWWVGFAASMVLWLPPYGQIRYLRFPPECGGELVDNQLLGQIELLSDVIADVARFPRRLSPRQLDPRLGVSLDARRQLSTSEENPAPTPGPQAGTDSAEA